METCVRAVWHSLVGDLKEQILSAPFHVSVDPSCERLFGGWRVLRGPAEMRRAWVRDMQFWQVLVWTHDLQAPGFTEVVALEEPVFSSRLKACHAT